MTYRPILTNNASVDSSLVDIYRILNNLSDTTSNLFKEYNRFKGSVNSFIKMYLSDTVKMTDKGGLAVKRINKTGSNTIKGEVVTSSSTTDKGVDKIVVNVPNPVGVFYESGVPDGQWTWVVVMGIADVYFVGNTTRGHLARGFLTSDGASYVSGRALSEAVPTSPFATDKHFYEIGHVNESRTGEGLAETFLHFN